MREFELMVEGGMPPMKPFNRRRRARDCEIEDRLGTLERRSSPTWWRSRESVEDIRAMRNVVFVMKEGNVFKPVTGIHLEQACMDAS
jgi:hypothetical protein